MNLLRKLGLLALAASLWMLQTACDDQYRPVANPILSPGGQPQTGHFAWVVSYNPSGPGTTTEINVSGDTNASVQNMGNGSVAEAFPSGSLALFIANHDNDTVSEYLPTLSGTITTVALLPGSHPVFLNSAQSVMMFVLNSGPNSACPTSGSVSTIPVASLAVSATVCVGSNPTSMVQSSANNYIYVVNGDGTVSVVNGSSVMGPITFPMGQTATAVAQSSNGSYIFILTADGDSPGTLYVVPAGATSVSASDSVPLGVNPTFAVLDPVLNRLYITNTGDNTVSVFDASNINISNSPPIPLLATVPVGAGPIGVAALPNSTNFYVANAGSDDVTVVSANSFSPLTTVPLPAGANPVFIASEPSSTKVYVADQGTFETTIIQTSNNTVVGNIVSPPQVPGCTSNCALQTPMMIVTE